MDDISPSKITCLKKRLFRYMTLALIFIAFVLATIYTISHNNIAKKREIAQLSEIENMKHRLLSEYIKTGSDLFYFSQSDLAKTVLQEKNQSDTQHLTSLMLKIAALHKNYDQLRLIDNQGHEVIRINQDRDFELTVVTQEMLQNKKDRYYYKKAAALNNGDLYVSKFDLNIENNQIETPTKPVIRFSTPIYSENNEFLGIGVINYLGKNAIELLGSLNVHLGDNLYLINSDGYYLSNKNSNKNWLFMFPEKEQIRFADEFPPIWKGMLKNKTGSISYKSDEFYYIQVQLTDFPLHNVINHEKIYIVMHTPKTTIQSEDKILITGLLIGSALIVPMILFLVYKLARSQQEQEKLIKKLHYQAFNDQLTGLYNRQAIYDYLRKNLLIYQRQGTLISIGFIDVNNLKEVNDSLGHEAGDELILGVADAINMSIRQSDFAARMGGDEFLVIFIDCDKDSAENTLKRIQKNYRSLGSEKGKEWSLCFGCAEVIDKNDTAEAMIERADQEMYTHKERLKQKGDDVALKVNKKDLIKIRTHDMNLHSKTHAVQSLDFEGNVLDVSSEWLKMTGYYREEAIGKHFTDFLDEVSYEQVKTNFPRLKGYGYVNNVELAIRRQDGTIVHTVLNGTAMYDDEGNFIRTFCEITPVSKSSSKPTL